MDQDLPDLHVSVFSSPQVGKFMEEKPESPHGPAQASAPTASSSRLNQMLLYKPPPSLHAVCGLRLAGGEPGARDVAAVPARSSGATFAARGSFVIIISNPWLARTPRSPRGDVPTHQQGSQSLSCLWKAAVAAVGEVQMEG